MRRKHAVILGLLLVLGLGLCIGAVAMQRAFENERTVSIAEVPEAVRAAILAQAQGNTINEIEMETENGQVVYEAEVIVEDKEVDIRVAADGTLLGQETDDEADDNEEEDEADDESDE